MDVVIRFAEHDPLAGTVGEYGPDDLPDGEEGHGPARPFVGWLGLLRVLEDLLEHPNEGRQR